MSNRHKQHNKAVRTGHQRGVALITALLILTISTTAAVFLTNQHQLSIRRTGNVIIGNQAYLYALGGEALAMSFLHEDFKENQEFDALNEAWAMETVPLPVEGDAGAIHGKLADLQGRFNINNLVNDSGGIDTLSITRFSDLLAYFGLEPGLADAVVDWIDPNTSAQGPFGAEDDFYVGLSPPYRAANAPMKSVSELRLVRGFAEFENLDLLMQHLTVLPEFTAINVNTASKEVLIALGVDPLIAEGIAIQTGVLADPQAATGTNANTGANAGATAGTSTGGNTASSNPLMTAVNQAASLQPFDTVTEFMNAANTGRVNPAGLDVSTHYFLYEGGAWLDRGRALLKSLLHRDNNGIMRVLMRSQGDL